MLRTSALVAVAAADCRDAECVLEQMTTAEKAGFFAGDLDAIDHISGVDRLGVPAVNMGDGPNGVANTVDGTATSFPCNMAAGDTFDPDLVERYASAMAKEFKAKGKNMILGPGVNFNRVPRCGRTDEYITGDDPVLGAELAKAFVKGARDEHLMVNVKHFGNNEQETNRNNWSANPDSKTQMEIYMKPFLAAVESGAASLMCGYNKVQGEHACKHKALLQKAKQTSDSFFVVSDWGAVYPDAAGDGALDYIEAGLDVEMGTHDTPGCDGHGSADASDYCNKGDYMLKDRILDFVGRGKLEEARLNETPLRVLKALETVGLLNPEVQAEFPTYTYDDLHTKFDGPLMKQDVRTRHSRQVAHEVALKAMVLLQNQNDLLPVGDTERFELYGCGDEVHFRAESGSAAGTKPFVPANPCLADDETACMYPNDALAVEGVALQTFRLDEAQSGPRDASALAVICVTAASKNSEGTDRQNLDLLGSNIPWDRFSRSVVWVVSPGPVLIPFADKVDAILYSALPGEMGGAAFADILLGKASPTGHLSLTLPNAEDETNVRVNPDSDDYAEGVVVGHRWYQANGVKPKFAFGSGLSYAKDLTITSADVVQTAPLLLKVELQWPKPTSRFGQVDQVVQIYVRHEQPARSYLEMAGFNKARGLESGSASTVIAVEQPRIWSSQVGERDAFDAGWTDVSEFTLFASLFGVEHASPIFTCSHSGNSTSCTAVQDQQAGTVVV